MNKIPIILVTILLVLINIALSDDASPRVINKGEIVSEVTNNQAKIIVGDGATIIIKSNNETNAKILATIVDLSSGGELKELMNDEIVEKINKNEVNKNEPIENQEVSLPQKFTIEKAYPNPFNPTMNMRFGLPTESMVRIQIFDVTGRIIADYDIGNRSAGWHEFRWNTMDMNGNEVGAGVYLVAIRAGDLLQKQKVTYIK